MMKFCDRCKTVDMTVERSRLKVPGIEPRGGCGCIFMCVTCRDITVAEYQQRAAS